MPTHPDCPTLTRDLTEIVALKQSFDTALATATQTGDTTAAQALRTQLETAVMRLRERLNPFETELHITDQYESQVRMLQDTGLVERLSTGELGIKAVDGKEYPLPTLSEVNQRMMEKREILTEKVPQGFTKLLLVPFGLDIQKLLETYKQLILKHHQAGKLLATKADPTDPDEPLALDTTNPLYVWDQITQAKLVYYPERFDADLATHKGKTKQQLLSGQPSSGWNMMLAEDLPNIPRKDKGKTIGNRPQLTTQIDPTNTDAYTTAMQTIIEPNQTTPSSREYLRLFQQPTGPYTHETVLTTEDQLILTMTHLVHTNQVLDDYQGKGSISYQLGSYVPSADRVVASCWNRGNQRAFVYGFNPDWRDVYCGVRSSVSLS